MAPTASVMVPLGTRAHEFSLPDYGAGRPGPTGRPVTLRDVAGLRATVVMFICNHCPFVKHVADELARIATEFGPRGVGFVGINSNDVHTYPADAPAEMTAEAARRGYPFAYLFDESQSVARAYRAVCTPDFFVYDHDLRLAYRGQLDGTRPNGGVAAHGADVRAALEALVSGRSPGERQTPSIGCNIKWKPGNEPG